MQRQTRKHGTAVSPILDPATGELLGWTCRWDDGQERRLMKSGVPAGLLDDITDERRGS